MIIRNLHNFLKNKQQETSLLFFSRLVSFVIFCLISFNHVTAQNSVNSQEKVAEKTNLEFQEHFFKAITEKSINNYQNAISSLDECNLLIPNNKAVLFELSKNYSKLKKYPEAIEYAKLALTKDAENVWILEHLVKTYKKIYAFNKAIKVQEKIILKHPKRKKHLVFLHLQNNDRNAAKKVLKELENAKMLNHRLRQIKANLEKRNKPKVIAKKQVITADFKNLKRAFEKDKSYKSLESLLTYLDAKNAPELLKYSEQGMELFPAQPFVYLMNGKTLNKQNSYKKAIESLKNGIDFVIDNAKVEAKFFKELIKAYNGIGDTKNAKKYEKKLRSK